MIRRVTVEYFKRFEKQTFELTDRVVLAGPNNSGKTTLLQAIAVWNLALRRWIEERKSSNNANKKGVPITWNEFTAIPMRDMKFLWWDTSVAFRKGEKPNTKPGYPRKIKIRLEGVDSGVEWAIEMELKHSSSRQIYVKPSQESLSDVKRLKPYIIAQELNAPTIPIDERADIEQAFEITIVHVPPFSGIGTEEIVYPRNYQDALIGQGKPADVVRNLLWELYNKDSQTGGDVWNEFCDNIKEIFGYSLQPPDVSGKYIICDYQDGKPAKPHVPPAQLDIASAGSGFHQVILLLAFFYARPSSVVLLDEPDAHQHFILQKQLFDRLREIASKRSCQLIIASHSEVLINAVDPENILSFYGDPHSLVKDTDKDRVVMALKQLSSGEILLGDRSPGILYVEGETDFNLLKAWAQVLGHDLANWFSAKPLWRAIRGSQPRNAKDHFFALKAINHQIQGYLLLDGDDRRLQEHEVTAEGLVIGRWERYEAESYLLHPTALERFISDKVAPLFVPAGMNYLRKELPQALFDDPLTDSDYTRAVPASKTLLPEFLARVDVHLSKKEYYLIAKAMQPEEVHPDVIQKLDDIYKQVRSNNHNGALS